MTEEKTGGGNPAQRTLAGGCARKTDRKRRDLAGIKKGKEVKANLRGVQLAGGLRGRKEARIAAVAEKRSPPEEGKKRRNGHH